MSELQLSQIYEKRFFGHELYRKKVWQKLISNFFSKWIKINDQVLDLGCGYGEFINQIKCGVRHAMDLNPKTKELLDENINFIQQDCSKPWNIKPESLDLIFTSNFFEHLPNKYSLEKTIIEIKTTLKPGGRIIAMGPNILVLKGQYWDFWDHHVALPDASLTELLQIHGFTIEYALSKFLPYNMVRIKQKPLFLLSLYLKLPLAWFFLGKQFLLVATKN